MTVIIASPNEAILLAVVVGTTILVYIIWMTVIIPSVCKNGSGWIQLAAYLGSNWLMYGVMAHLYLICRGATAVPAIFCMPMELLQHAGKE